MFDRAAYGCRLFCCWCAQDIEANRFWESLGFVPLAFRAGSAKKSRVHIFWQKRIRPGDETTPWWFPAQTTGGSIRADRLVLPIPPGVHWSGAKPIILPSTPVEPADKPARRALPAPGAPRAAKKPQRAAPRVLCGFRFQAELPPAPPVAAKPPRQKPPRMKNDPLHLAAARELRDRWLEEVGRDPSLILPQGKYDLARALPATGPLPHGRGSLPEGGALREIIEVKALPAAA